jgi:hypothetical protein
MAMDVDRELLAKRKLHEGLVLSIPKKAIALRTGILGTHSALIDPLKPAMGRMASSTRKDPLRILLEQYGLALVFGSLLLERIGLPLPAVPVLIAGGGLAAEGAIRRPQCSHSRSPPA